MCPRSEGFGLLQEPLCRWLQFQVFKGDLQKSGWCFGMCCSRSRALEIRFVAFPLPQFPLIPTWMGAAFADLNIFTS